MAIPIILAPLCSYQFLIRYMSITSMRSKLQMRLMFEDLQLLRRLTKEAILPRSSLLGTLQFPFSILLVWILVFLNYATFTFKGCSNSLFMNHATFKIRGRQLLTYNCMQEIDWQVKLVRLWLWSISINYMFTQFKLLLDPFRFLFLSI